MSASNIKGPFWDRFEGASKAHQILGVPQVGNSSSGLRKGHGNVWACLLGLSLYVSQSTMAIDWVF